MNRRDTIAVLLGLGAARLAFGPGRYSPTLKDGQPVKSQKVVEIL
jgi:hypothetical protein